MPMTVKVERTLEHEGNKIIQATRYDLTQALIEQEKERRANPGGWTRGRTMKLMCNIPLEVYSGLLAAGNSGNFNHLWAAIRARDSGNEQEFKTNLKIFLEQHPEWRS